MTGKQSFTFFLQIYSCFYKRGNHHRTMNMIAAIILIAIVAFVVNMKNTKTDTPKNLPPVQSVQPQQQIVLPPVIPQQAPQAGNNWVYPGATKISDSVYESSDDPMTITNWYKNKINTSGMSVTSFVVTSTNNNVLNKLAGGSSTQNVSVEISKKQNDGKTTITLR